MYQLLRSILFNFSPESVHHFSMKMLKLVCSTAVGRKLLTSLFTNKDARLTTEFLGLPFRNPVGLAAGFDKNAEYLQELECLGFGFVEIGTVTPLGQPGNDKPRVFRLPKDQALINRMGFNNEGVKAVVERLKKWKERQAVRNPGAPEDRPRMIIGGNIGKNKLTPNEEAWKDYERCFIELHPYVDYFVVNVSSPNTPGLRALQEKESLRKILVHLQELNRATKTARPVLLKIAPDLTPEQLDDVAALAVEIKLDGLVATNTTISREGLSREAEQVSREAGGLSGKPLQQRSTDVLKYLVSKTNGQVPIIASGGIFTGADASGKLEAGARLVQVWTGFIYVGPAIVKKITRALCS
ncbi:MAG: quinone-dependent dihydroorotate dehydrogenase [Sphingobacteriales bacterium]|nr:quinone-dependent dihydroorotate dehydrogenase [Sphingobacteriales bacterium]